MEKKLSENLDDLFEEKKTTNLLNNWK